MDEKKLRAFAVELVRGLRSQPVFPYVDELTISAQSMQILFINKQWLPGLI